MYTVYTCTEHCILYMLCVYCLCLFVLGVFSPNTLLPFTDSVCYVIATFAGGLKLLTFDSEWVLMVASSESFEKLVRFFILF